MKKSIDDSRRVAWTVAHCVAVSLLLTTSTGGATAGGLPMTSEFVDAGMLTLDHIEPVDGSVLSRSARIWVTATAKYDLQAAESGALTLAVQDQTGRDLVVGKQARQPILRGSDTESLSSEIVVPESATEVTVFIALMATGYSGTNTVVTVHYAVAK